VPWLRQALREAGYFQTTVDGDAAATLLIDEQKLSLQFGCDNDGFGFTWIEFPPEHRNVVLVLGCNDTCLRIQIGQQVEFAHSGEVEDWGSVGNDDQAPGSLFTR